MGIGRFEDDSGLIRGCVRRDVAAWASLIKKYSCLITISIENRLKKYSIVLSKQDIEDIRQNILASLWRDRKIDTIKDHDSVPYWLAIVSGNEAIVYARKLSREPKIPASLFEKMDEKEFMELIPSDAANPKEGMLGKELSQKIDAAMESLPPKERLVMELNIIYDKKYDEISEMLSLPKGTVSSYLKRAKERLRKKLINYFAIISAFSASYIVGGLY